MRRRPRPSEGPGPGRGELDGRRPSKPARPPRGFPERPRRGWAGRRILSVGHSTRPFDELLALLAGHGVRTLIDVRTIPRSRRHPQFDQKNLRPALAKAGIAYEHLPQLGGLRHGMGAASPNGGWRNASFRGYADHMLSGEFEEGLEALRTLAGKAPVAVMCAEAVPWRCHRSLLADALLARGVWVEHIVDPRRTQPHRPTPFARIDGLQITYPPEGTNAP